MQFEHPEFFYALFLLLIPIIVHFFQLRKFQKIAFTNVSFLKAAILKKRKSSKIKKWLILSTRLLIFASIILAFAQPFTSKIDVNKTKKETVIYLDNSFSMEAKGTKGTLLKRAVQDIINHVEENQNISLLTNNTVYKNTSIKAIKNDLLQLEYSSNTLPTNAALLKSNSLFSKQANSIKNLVFISDFQDHKAKIGFKTDSLTNLYLVKLRPVMANNISVDSAYISNTTATNIQLKVKLKQRGKSAKSLPVSLFNNDTLIAKTSVEILDEASTTFSLPLHTIINGKIAISDAYLQFDNSLYFNINKGSKINVLAINEAEDWFLKRIYTATEFNYMSALKDDLNYNYIENQHLIVLNELDIIPNALVSALKLFTNQGGYIIIIPSKNITIPSYNELLLNYELKFNDIVNIEKRITSINYTHPLYSNGVFEKQVKNFQYPKVNGFYNLALNTASAVLQFEDGRPFLCENKNAFVFTSALNRENSSFKNAPLIVPTLYNIGKYSFKIPKLYYTIGKENTFDVNTKLQQDDILSLVNKTMNIIPKQQYFNNKVVINTSKNPSVANTYSIQNKNKTIKNVSYNYDRYESNLTYQDISTYKNSTQSDSVTEIFNIIKSDTKVNHLWKWFVIFALIFLIIEMLILKYFK